ncbi:adenylate/guanylate cyclase domain-containing protein [Haematospirillum jordaniae]|uniref:adenylate/guanylate cyclase domain-containing protein n=1 Tax=Haematospirillum jordaniae TaxID=1549855 RepID=UPI001432BA7A|nr:adenylate/guanylate cyclase domain-containing protein [Haematospirillum jordaniae]NKD44235.1 adenylate/guanylate cyclase domain-containing protein [Haematospirillum jordaniae]NKD91512.1 adenylate/guanylate cyclase domain-containing protein [Haematospirillum jordaniae]
MAAATNYEIYTQDGRGNWTLHARYPGRDREDAMEEAKEVERLRNIPVRVVKEVYYPENNTTEENIIYSGRVKPKPETSGSMMKSGVAPVRHSHGGQSTSPTNTRSSSPQFGKPANKTGDFIFRLSMVLLLSGLIAIVATGITSLVMKQVAQSGLPVEHGTQSIVLFGVFVGVFLLGAVPLIMTYVPLDALGGDNSGNRKLTPPRKAAPRGSSRSATEALAERVDRAPDSRPEKIEGSSTSKGDILEALLPEDEAEWPALKASDPKKAPQKKKKKKAEDKQATQTGKTDTASSEQSPAKADIAGEPQAPSPTFDKARLESMKFLGSIIESIKTSYPNLDAYNRFGLNLYLCGACEHLAQSQSLSKKEKEELSTQALEIIGTKPEQARQMIQRLDTYRQEARYRTMIAAGISAMRAHLSSDSDPLHALGGVMKQWNTPQTQQLSTSGVTILFTDMANSTSMTQELGDAAAQDIIRAHNTIVRNALLMHRGKEVKHTGDGIMATFDGALDAVQAAINIQEKAAEHTARWPRLALKLRIGMNSGDPIVEENDYFGATVQIAARVCACAGVGQIWLGESTKALIPDSTDLLISSRGAQELKGVPDPVELFEVSYDQGTAGQPQPSGSGEGNTGGQPQA